ncbi:hypothetical protein ABK040_008697 [Willaertia magna]
MLGSKIPTPQPPILERLEDLFKSSVSLCTKEDKEDVFSDYYVKFNVAIPPDVTIKCKEDKEIKAHQFILSLSSEVFEKMFYGEFKKENIIELVDYDVVIVEQFLQYLYCGTIKLNEENCFAILDLSKQYMMAKLKEDCKTKLENIIEFCNTNDNNGISKLLQIYEQCLFFDEGQLISNCLTKFGIISSSLFDKRNMVLNELSKEAMKKLIESDKITVNEVTIFTKVLQWIEGNVDDKEQEMELFNEFKLLIRFPLMSNSELLSTIFESKKLSEEELLNLLRFKEFGSKIEIPYSKTPRNEPFVKPRRGIFKDELYSSKLWKEGWRELYCRNFSSPITRDELMEIKLKYNNSRFLCVASKHNATDCIHLAAIDTIENALKETSNSKVASSGSIYKLYWYFDQRYGVFGFSNESKINLNDGDSEKGDLRLSWRLSGSRGGGRVGDKDLTGSTDWQKIIFLK